RTALPVAISSIPQNLLFQISSPPPLTVSPLSRGSRGPLGSGWRGRGEREGEREGAALVDPALDGARAALELERAPGDGEGRAGPGGGGAGGVGGVIEEGGDGVGGDAAAGVGHGDADDAVGVFLPGAPLGPRLRLGPDGDAPLGVRELDRVPDELRDDQLE